MSRRRRYYIIYYWLLSLLYTILVQDVTYGDGHNLRDARDDDVGRMRDRDGND